MQRLCCSTNSVGNQAEIECGELAAMSLSKRQQIGVRYLSGVQQSLAVDSLVIEESYIVGPELMTAQRAQKGEDFCNRRRSPRGVGIARMADDTENAVFCERTGGPGFLSGCGKPIVRAVMLHMKRVDEGDQDIYIEQIAD